MNTSRTMQTGITRSNNLQPVANAGKLVAPTYASVFQTVLARADLVYAQSLIVRTHSKGNLGEALALRAFLRNKFEEGRNWISLTPRTGRQGFDHLFVRINPNGSYSFMVGESKYGSSQLGVTQGNVRQMSWTWIHSRANKLGDAYLSIASKNVSLKKMPFFSSGIKSYDVIIDGSKVTFWRDSNGNWYFTGTANQIAKAQKEAAKMGRALKFTTIRARLFRITKSGDDIIIRIDRVNSAKNSGATQIIKGKSIVLKGVLAKHISDAELKAQIAAELKKSFPGMKEGEIRELTEDLARKYKNGTLLEEAKSVAKSIALQSLVAAGIAGGIDLMLQLISQKEINWKRVGLAASSAAIGAACGQLLAIGLLKTRAGATVVRYFAHMAGLRSFSLIRNSMAGSAGGVVTTAILSYGAALLGYASWRDANRDFVAGTTGIAGGVIASTSTTSLVAAYGVSGTGTAISTLSGAAANNATLAWLGMGAGMKVGAVVLGGIVVVTAVAVSCAVTWAFIVYDKKEQRAYAMLLEEKFRPIWGKIAENRLIAV